jgi:hypothetical protein
MRKWVHAFMVDEKPKNLPIKMRIVDLTMVIPSP